MDTKAYDVAVIGGGPAGMMAAIRAGARGARVILLEKNPGFGLKLLSTGNGRCNLTNVSADAKENISVYGKKGKFLLSAFHRFGTRDAREFFRMCGVATKVEDNGRVFPESDKARDVLGALLDELSKLKVEILSGAEVKEIIGQDSRIEKAVLADGKEIIARNFIVAVGGMSMPGTGSTGDGYGWLKGLGQTIVEPRPALTPITVKERFVKELEGLSLEGAAISVFKNGKKIASKTGEALFTADGMSGPAIIDLSGIIGEALPGKINLNLDFNKEIDVVALDCKLHNDFQVASNKLLRNYLSGIIPARLASVILALLGIDGDKQVNAVTREERKALARILKEFSLEVTGLKGFDRAMITAGGAELKEIDPTTMRSKLFENLYLAGEILDIHGPTGGYNLQICWSTGYTAGDSVTLK